MVMRWIETKWFNSLCHDAWVNTALLWGGGSVHKAARHAPDIGLSKVFEAHVKWDGLNFSVTPRRLGFVRNSLLILRVQSSYDPRAAKFYPPLADVWLFLLKWVSHFYYGFETEIAVLYNVSGIRHWYISVNSKLSVLIFGTFLS